MANFLYGLIEVELVQTSLIIIVGTEFKTHVPNALCLQSQLYSSYKSSTTLKALIGCDSCGSVIFISNFLTGSIFDKAIGEESGFYQLLKDFVEHGYIQRGDCVMADKEFTIANEIGIGLNIPPFATGSQMSMQLNIERLIVKVKTYKLLSHTVPTCRFKSVNKIWTVCCF